MNTKKTKGLSPENKAMLKLLDQWSKESPIYSDEEWDEIEQEIRNLRKTAWGHSVTPEEIETLGYVPKGKYDAAMKVIFEAKLLVSEYLWCFREEFLENFHKALKALEEK